MVTNAAECGLEPRIEILDEDQTLVCAARHDTQEAGRLYDQYYGRIFAYLYHCTLDPNVTEDLTSNVFLAAFTHLGRFRWWQTPFKAWLYRFATNEVRTFYRRRRSARGLRLGCRRALTNGFSPSAEEDPAAADEYRLVHQAMLQLRPKYRTVVILRYFEDKTMAGISEITGAREGTVKCHLHRGLARLQEILTANGKLDRRVFVYRYRLSAGGWIPWKSV